MYQTKPQQKMKQAFYEWYTFLLSLAVSAIITQKQCWRSNPTLVWCHNTNTGTSLRSGCPNDSHSNTKNYSPNDTVSLPTRSGSSATHLWQPQISHPPYNKQSEMSCTGKMLKSNFAKDNQEVTVLKCAQTQSDMYVFCGCTLQAGLSRRYDIFEHTFLWRKTWQSISVQH